MATLLSRRDRIKVWLEEIKNVWGPQKPGENLKRVDEQIEESVALVKRFDLAMNTVVLNYSRKGKTTARQYIAEQALARKVNTVDEVMDMLAEAIETEGVPDEETIGQKAPPPKLCYGRKNHCYWEPVSDCYQSITGDMATVESGLAGMSTTREGGISEVDEYLSKVRHENGVEWAGPLAGYKAGLHIINDKPYLATHSFKEIETKPDPGGDHCQHLLVMTYGLFGETQADYVLAHLKDSRHCLREGLRMGGLATLIAGDAGIAKTFFIECVVKPALGGRLANVYDYLTKRTPFNKEMIGSEVHLIDDGNPFADREARKEFSNMIKQEVASAGVYCHAKGIDGITLPLFRRFFLVTNTDALEAMPTLESSLLDKILLFKAHRFMMPEDMMPLPPLNDAAKIRAFQAMLAEELPYFLWLVDNKEVPDEIKAERFGLKAFKNPELMVELEAMEQNNETHFLIQTAVFERELANGNLEPAKDGSVEIETNALLTLLLTEQRTAERAKRMFKDARTLGCALGKMGRFNRFYRHRESNGRSYWRVKPDSGESNKPNIKLSDT